VTEGQGAVAFASGAEPAVAGSGMGTETGVADAASGVTCELTGGSRTTDGKLASMTA